MTALKSLWNGLHYILRAALFGVCAGAVLIGLVMTLTLTSFDWWGNYRTLLLCWGVIALGLGYAYTRDPKRLEGKLLDKIAEKL